MRPMIAKRVLVAAGVGAMLLGPLVLEGAAGPRRPVAPHALPVTAGYPYAHSCPAAGPADTVDRWLMYECNCTSYVAWALEANHQRTNWFVAGEMDAYNWPAIARSHGILTGTVPRVGAVAVWPRMAPPFGHIAYVTAVGPTGTFDVAEYNLPAPDGSDTYTFERRTALRRSGVSFIYVPRRAH